MGFELHRVQVRIKVRVKVRVRHRHDLWMNCLREFANFNRRGKRHDHRIKASGQVGLDMGG